ncbi:MAG TPA: intradiol ring-cleavage dioxygenase, partial [Tepidiformaceae bacterium]|nr:intradiol ring-cleavage dioxygenase [Tepidiformaceae bacterium]
HEHDEPHDRGLQHDLATLLHRRHALKLLSGAAMVALVGCSDDSPASTPTTAPIGGTPTTGATRAAPAAATTSVSPIRTGATPLSACVAITPETAGPFPGNGSNGPNALTQSGIVRTDIRSSLGGGATAGGVVLAMELTLVDTDEGCVPLAGAAVYLWHCDREGRYSMYSQGVTNETYLRGVGETDANGVVRFTSVFPGAYPGRWPHVHFEIYPSLALATSSANKRATSQLAFPEDVCNVVYATAGYEDSVSNMRQTTLANDNVFRDGVDLQMATMSGSVGAGYTARLLVGV